MAAGVNDSEGVALVVGAGDALGGAVARRFADAGYTACVARRTAEGGRSLATAIEAAGGKAVAWPLDARNEEQVIAMFDRIESEVGPVEVAVFNVGAWSNESILTIEARKYTKVWEMACLAGFLTGREAARRMVPRGRGTIIFTGATASMRGSAGFAAFAGAKFGLRALAQSMARELAPKGVHVAHVVIDGAIDTAFVRERFPDMVAERPEDGLLSPDDIAGNYLALHKQPRSAWTHELDLRPWAEPW